MSYRDEARRALESSAARSVQNEYLTTIKERHRALEALRDVDDLLALLRDPSADLDRKDAILLALLKEHQREGGEAFALLAVAMFPKLDHIHRMRCHRYAGGARKHPSETREEVDDFWGRVVGAFAEALDRYPTDRRPAKVAANIEGDTLAALRRARLRETRAEFAQMSFGAEAKPFENDFRVPSADEAGAAYMTPGDLVPPGGEAAVAPDREEVEQAARLLDPFVEADVIDEDERYILLGVHLYERTLGDLARELGISREAAKKRHLRAMTRLRRAARSSREDPDD
jgi:DNA-directed RNA polymerase specialized sigma24 family protein